MGRRAEHRRPAARRGVAEFLRAHDPCRSDFDVHRTRAGAGDGGLRLACNGCGERASYDVGEPGVLKLLGAPGPAAELAAEAPRRTRTRTRADLERWLPTPAALPWWVPSAYIVAVIAIGLAMVAFGLINRDGGERAVLGDRAADPPAAPAPSAPVTSGAAPPAAATARPGPRLQGDARPELDGITVLGRFEIGLPEGWLGGTADGGFVFRPESGAAELRVFLEPGDEGPRSLAERAKRFLRAEHPGARVREVGPGTLRGAAVYWLEARWKGGSERAGLLSESGYEYLVLSRVERGAGREARAAADASLQSFKVL